MKISDLLLTSEGRVRSFWGFLFFLPAFVAFAFVIVFAMVLAIGQERLQSGSEFGLLIQGVAMLGASLLAGWFLLRFLDRRSFRTLGLWFYKGWGRELGIGLLLGAGFNAAAVSALRLLGYLKYSPAGQPMASLLPGLAWTLLVIAVAATAEEALFRGYPFQRLIESWGPAGAVLFLSVLFGWGHWSNPSATILSTLNVALAGILLAMMYLKTRALWVPIGFHISWNYIMGSVFSLPVSGITLEARLFSVEITGPNWLSGGGFGPEGSVLATAVLLAGCVWLARTEKITISPEQLRELQLYPIVRVEGKEL